MNNTGQAFYSNISSAYIEVKEFSAAIYPNPANGGTANLKIQNPSGSKVVINVFDFSGNKLVTVSAAEVPNQTIRQTTKNLSAGTYLVEVITIANKYSTLLQVK